MGHTAAAAVEVRRLDRAVHRERAGDLVDDQPAQHLPRDRELDQLRGRRPPAGRWRSARHQPAGRPCSPGCWPRWAWPGWSAARSGSAGSCCGPRSAGVVIISLGYMSGLGNPLEQPLIGLINGPAAPFRNLWKFDPMLRLPLALGLAHLIAAARVPRLRGLLIATAALALGSVGVLGFATGLASPGSFSQVPAYWVSAADWLTAHAGNQAVLVEPGAPFGEYIWGAPMDDVLQALTSVDYAERNLGALGSVGNERLLNAIDQQFAAGDGSAGLTEVLARMGVKYVVVRNDLSGSAARRDLAGPDPRRARRVARPDARGAVRPADGQRGSGQRGHQLPRALSRGAGLPGGGRGAGRRRAARRGRAARLRRPGIRDHAGQRGPARRPAGAAQQRRSGPAGRGLGRHRLAAPPRRQLRRAPDELLADAHRHPVRQTRSCPPTTSPRPTGAGTRPSPSTPASGT